jgi:reductive dehalogenase
MYRLHSNRDRPHHLSPWPLERLARSAVVAPAHASMPGEVNAACEHSINAVLPEYVQLFTRFFENAVAPAQAPIPADPIARANNLKASAYFLDAAIAGVCALEPAESTACNGHRFAFVYIVEFGREPASGEPGDAWIRGTNVARTDLRVAELSAVLSGYIRWLGFSARGHAPSATQVDLAALAVRAGIARAENGKLVAPFLRRGFRVGVITTDLAIEPDQPLALSGLLVPRDASLYMGMGGTRPLWWYDEEAKRPLHMGRYAMERIKRVTEPTTLVIEDEIGRVPKRGDFFKRAEAGDLGEKPKRERRRFPMKHPIALGMQPLIQNMVPLQGTREPLTPTGIGGDLIDPRRNADAIKALGHYLGADFVGICEAKPWMYYSHDDVEGKPLAAYHRYAVVMLIDQGFESMDGSSGDDWISAAMSMRAYLRGAEIAGVMAAHCRRMGYSARSHSNAHSEVIHNPAILMAGLGEVSRIGDTILNPFIGPRSKSVVFTTDLPMTVDLPIDFGLQSFCEGCRKCARECPCAAIPFGPKVMFNGYEIWKADVEKCTKYRVTNMKGSACGRCMKTCPWNREDLVEAERLMWLSIETPEARDAIVAQDDLIGAGARNPVKRWWFDVEVVDGVPRAPVAGVNERDLDLARIKLADTQKLAMFPPALQPPAGATMADLHPIDREAGLRAYVAAESPSSARERLAAIPIKVTYKK